MFANELYIRILGVAPVNRRAAPIPIRRDEFCIVKEKKITTPKKQNV